MPLEEARHAAKTLRLRPGSLLELCDGRGHTVLAQLAAVDRQGAVVTTAEAPVQVRGRPMCVHPPVLRCAWVRAAAAPHPLPGFAALTSSLNQTLLASPPLLPQARLSGWQWEVACACGSLKGGRSDVLVEKCAELGAAAFTPVLTDRSPTIGGGGEQGRAHSGKRAGRRRGGLPGAARQARPGEDVLQGRCEQWSLTSMHVPCHLLRCGQPWLPTPRAHSSCCFHCLLQAAKRARMRMAAGAAGARGAGAAWQPRP